MKKWLKMTNSGFYNMISAEKNLWSNQKSNRTCYFPTTPADRLKIEILINKNKISATYNKDNKVNKLVTVFADALSEQSQNPNQFR